MSAEAKTFDPVLLAVLSNRIEGITREMMNTLFRTGRSAVLAMSRDFSCAIVTADNQLLTGADGIPVHVFGANLLIEAMQELHPNLREGDAFLHNDPYRGNTHAADDTLLVPVFHEGRHLFTVTAKAHQADCGTASRRRTCHSRATCTRRARSSSRACACSRTTATTRTSSGCAAAGSACRTSGTAITSRRSARCASASGASRSCSSSTARRRSRRSSASGWTTRSAAPRRRSQSSPREVTATGLHDPFPALPDGLEIKVTARIDPAEGTIEVDLRDNPDCVPAGINQTMASSISNATIGVFNSLGGDIPRNAGSFRRLRILPRENCCAGIPTFPHSCSMATTNISGLLVNTTQRAFAALGDGYGLAEGGNSLGPGQAVISGGDPARGGEPYVNQLFAAVAGGPAEVVPSVVELRDGGPGVMVRRGRA